MMLDPEMPAQELRLHMGEMTESEERTARAAIRWANAERADEGMNQRFTMWLRSNGLSMADFIAWVHDSLREYCEETGTPRHAATADQAKFDAWLEEKHGGRA